MRNLLFSAFFFFSLSSTFAQNDERAQIEFKTDYGRILVELLNETPLHRDNFLKQVKSGTYNGVLWHRVINKFIIQTGDRLSKKAKPGEMLGDGDETPADWIPAEFRAPWFYHQRGMLNAAREGEDTNPEKKSSSTQFTIVTGRTFDDEGLDKNQKRVDEWTKGQCKYTKEMRETYKTLGGAPHLDGSYTVFGRVVEGMDVVDKIQVVETDKNDRPLKDVRIKKAKIVKNIKDKVKYDVVHIPEAPFEMPDIAVPVFPEKYVYINKCGAKQRIAKNHSDSIALAASNSQAISRAMEKCNKVGGGHVVIPKGKWLVGPIHFKSNCDLRLEEGSELVFMDEPELYLPAVMTSWEGMECFNYSPLVYAYQCRNVGISGKGKLAPLMGLWKTWFVRPKSHLDGLVKLYNWGAFDAPVEERQIADGTSHLRPHLIQFNQCQNIVLENFSIRESPFWTIHMYRCFGGVARGLDVYAHGHNNDGIDLEMTQNFLVENCTFDQGDDAVVIKSGRNQDAWRVGMPTRNIVVRNCTINKGHVLLGIGSEISGGVYNVYMHDCVAPNEVYNLFYVKTNERRGAIIDGIWMERIKAGQMKRALAIDTDVLYQWRDLVPTYKDSITTIRNLHIKDVFCRKAIAMIELNGDKRLPVENVTVSNIHVDSISSFVSHTSNVNGYKETNLTYDWLGNTGEGVNMFK